MATMSAQYWTEGANGKNGVLYFSESDAKAYARTVAKHGESLDLGLVAKAYQGAALQTYKTYCEKLLQK